MRLGTTLIGLLVLTLGCSTYKPIPVGDGGLYSGKPCQAPCFHSIVPGTTSVAEFTALRQSDKMFAPCTGYDLSASGGTQGYKCAFGTVGIIHNTVVGVTFWPSVPVRIRDVIAKYGNPQKAALIQENLLPEETESLALRLYYEDPCMVLLLNAEPGNRYVAAEDSLISKVDYMAPSMCLGQAPEFPIS